MDWNKQNIFKSEGKFLRKIWRDIRILGNSSKIIGQDFDAILTPFYQSHFANGQKNTVSQETFENAKKIGAKLWKFPLAIYAAPI